MHLEGLVYCPLWANSVFNGAKMVFIDVDQIDKMALQGVNSSMGHRAESARAETDLLNLQCSVRMALQKYRNS